MGVFLSSLRGSTSCKMQSLVLLSAIALACATPEAYVHDTTGDVAEPYVHKEIAAEPYTHVEPIAAPVINTAYPYATIPYTAPVTYTAPAPATYAAAPATYAVAPST